MLGFHSLGLGKKLTLPSAAEALPGRATPIPTAIEHFVNGHPLKGPYPAGCQTAVFGMGCFWGAERKFWELPQGVYVTAVGYAGGLTPNPTYEEVCSGRTGHNEVVLVVFDPAVLPYAHVLKTFWENHNPTQGMRQGNDVGTQYRSGIYYTDETDQNLAREVMAQAQTVATRPIVTELLPLSHYSCAEAYHQNYFAQHPEQGYCAFVVAPKVQKFLNTFAARVKSN